MKLSKVLLFTLLLPFSFQSSAQRIQFANNSPDNAFQGIDIYVDGMLFIDNLPFRNASSFTDILPGVYTIDIAAENSTSVNDAFYTTTLMVTPPDTIVAITNGTNTSLGFTPHKPFSLDVFMGAREAAHDPNAVELLFANGSTDAGIIDFRTGIDTWINNLDLGDITGYNQYQVGFPQTFRITNATGSTAFGTYDLTPQFPWTGMSGIVIASGFLNPANNNNGPAFSAMIVFANGGAFQPLNTMDPEAYARVQLIHNSVDILADTVDVYVNNDLYMNDVPALTASNFIDAPAKLPLDIGIAPRNSTSSIDTFYNLNITFDSARTYILATHGIESSTGYNPAPPFSIKVFNQAKENPSTAGSTDILFMHGSTDKPGISIDSKGSSWISSIYDGDFSAAYTTKSSADYVITVRDLTSAIDTLRYNASLQGFGWANKAITLLASGFKNPANNSNGLPFKLYVATADGGPLFPLTVVPPEPINVSNTAANNKVNIYPNPATGEIRITGISNLANSTVTFYTTVGTIAKTMQLTGENLYIADLTNGIYFVQVNAASGEIIHQAKLVKQ